MCFLHVGSRRGVSERCAAAAEAQAGSPVLIEDDISDYPKDRNLSLSVISLRANVSKHVKLNRSVLSKHFIYR